MLGLRGAVASVVIPPLLVPPLIFAPRTVLKAWSRRTVPVAGAFAQLLEGGATTVIALSLLLLLYEAVIVLLPTATAVNGTDAELFPREIFTVAGTVTLVGSLLRKPIEAACGAGLLKETVRLPVPPVAKVRLVGRRVLSTGFCGVLPSVVSRILGWIPVLVLAKAPFAVTMKSTSSPRETAKVSLRVTMLVVVKL